MSEGKIRRLACPGTRGKMRDGAPRAPRPLRVGGFVRLDSTTGNNDQGQANSQLLEQTAGKGAPSHRKYESFTSHQYIGLSLGGGKSDRSCVAVLEYYPRFHRLFVRQLFQNMKGSKDKSVDQLLYEKIIELSSEVRVLALDVPLSLPLCMTCVLPCPGFEECNEEHIRWFWKSEARYRLKKRPFKLFTPYTQRCVERYLATSLDEPITVSDAMGSNAAPLTARAHFLKRRLKMANILEVVPKASVWRVGTALGVGRSNLRKYRHSAGGESHRADFLRKFVSTQTLFLYEQDYIDLVRNPHVFDAFITGVTGFLADYGQCEERPKDFPRNEAWIALPRQNLVFDCNSPFQK